MVGFFERLQIVLEITPFLSEIDLWATRPPDRIVWSSSICTKISNHAHLLPISFSHLLILQKIAFRSPKLARVSQIWSHQRDLRLFQLAFSSKRTKIRLRTAPRTRIGPCGWTDHEKVARSVQEWWKPECLTAKSRKSGFWTLIGWGKQANHEKSIFLILF